MAPSKLFPEFPLPLELLYEIMKLLPITDLKTLSLASRLTRSQAIHFIFRHLRCMHDLRKVRNIHQAGKDVKAVIKKLELKTNDKDSLVMFQFLETLPNLQVLDFGELVPQHLSEFISSIRHTTLLELVLYTSNFFHVKGPPTTGLADLEKLSINWYADDNPNEPGSSLAHLYEFIRPSLTTLVEFRIELRYVFDLQLLKPTADTLRTFEYTLYSPHPCADESILDTISSILPHLTKLSIKWNNVQTEQSILWKDAYIQALSKHNNLTDLSLSSDFEEDTVIAVNAYSRLSHCYRRRRKATDEIASACPRLQRCTWFQGYKIPWKTTHSFFVEELITDGNVTRVVRGIKQPWMSHGSRRSRRGL